MNLKKPQQERGAIGKADRASKLQQWQNYEKLDQVRNEFSEKGIFMEPPTEFPYNSSFRGWCLLLALPRN